MLVESEEKLSGNARFEGFTVDLATELSKLLHFNFTFKLVDDGNVSINLCKFISDHSRLDSFFLDLKSG